MSYDSSMQIEAKAVRITITLNRKVYEDIKRVSDRMGLRPSTWMTMVCTSKIRNVDILIDNQSSHD